jgi:hypothetical protein
MRGHAGRALPADFSRRVGRAIADDLAAEQHRQVEAVVSGSRRPLLRWGGGAALAASVALVALIGSRSLSSPDSGTAPSVAATSIPATTTVPTPIAPGVPPPTLSSPVPQPPIVETGVETGADTGTVLAAAATAATVGSRRAVRPRILASAQAVSVPATVSGNPLTAALRASADSIDHAAASGPTLAHTEATSKPWPRALVPGASAGGALNAGYVGAEGLELHGLQSDLVEPQHAPSQSRSFPGTRQQRSDSSNEDESPTP